MPEVLVVDASALVEFLADSALGVVVGRRLQEGVLHAPASLDLEVLSGLGRLHRKDRLSVRQVATRLDWLNRAPIARHLLGPLVAGAWQKRHRVSLPDGLYVELAERLQAPLLTTDARLGRAYPGAEVVTAGP